MKISKECIADIVAELPSITSKNFSFLAKINPKLMQLLHDAEILIIRDPDAAASKLRSMLEIVIESISNRYQISFPMGSSLFQRLKSKDLDYIVPAEIVEKMHRIRKAGNSSSHGICHTKWKSNVKNHPDDLMVAEYDLISPASSSESVEEFMALMEDAFDIARWTFVNIYLEDPTRIPECYKQVTVSEGMNFYLAAILGDDESQNRLGDALVSQAILLLNSNDSIKKEYASEVFKLGISWYESSAEKDNLSAHYNIYLASSIKEFINNDSHKLRKYHLDKAIAGDHPGAIFNWADSAFKAGGLSKNAELDDIIGALRRLIYSNPVESKIPEVLGMVLTAIYKYSGRDHEKLEFIKSAATDLNVDYFMMKWGEYYLDLWDLKYGDKYCSYEDFIQIVKTLLKSKRTEILDWAILSELIVFELNGDFLLAEKRLIRVDKELQKDKVFEVFSNLIIRLLKVNNTGRVNFWSDQLIDLDPDYKADAGIMFAGVAIFNLREGNTKLAKKYFRQCDKYENGLARKTMTELDPLLRKSKAVPFMREKDKVGANEICSCGSGRKFKKCCRV